MTLAIPTNLLTIGFVHTRRDSKKSQDNLWVTKIHNMTLELSTNLRSIGLKISGQTLVHATYSIFRMCFLLAALTKFT